MSASFFSHNGVLKPESEASVSLFDINYAYGYGVYETLKLRRGVLYFPDQHCDRLHHSAEVIGMEIPWGGKAVECWIRELVAANEQESANVKLLCVGDSRGRKGQGQGQEAEVNLYIMMLNPLFPPRRLYSQGARVITAHGERHFPTAKTLDMLLSAVLYRRARAHDAYDALLINPEQCVTEGTRTNLFVTDGAGLFTPPADQTLGGVTKRTVIECARAHGLVVQERRLPWDEFDRWDGVFLTSTSSKIVPVAMIDKRALSIPTVTRELIAHYDGYLADYTASASVKAASSN